MSQKIKRKYILSDCPEYKSQNDCDSDNDCRWNSSKSKCYKKRTSSGPKVLGDVPKKTYCPKYQLEDACVADKHCKWNSASEKCYKKPLKRSYEKSYCPTYVLQDACDMDVECAWNWNKEKCYKKQHKKRNVEVDSESDGDNDDDLFSVIKPSKYVEVESDDSVIKPSKYVASHAPSKRVTLGKKVHKWNDFLNKYRNEHPEYSLKEAMQKGKDVYKHKKGSERKTEKRKYEKSECPGHKSRDSCSHHDGCRWSDKKEKCLKKQARKTSKKVKSIKEKVEKCNDYSLKDDCDSKEMCAWNEKKEKCFKKKGENPWNEFLKEYMRLNPNVSLHQAMIEASFIYQKEPKRKTMRSYRKTECPKNKTLDECDNQDECKWNAKKERCYSKPQRKKSQKKSEPTELIF